MNNVLGADDLSEDGTVSDPVSLDVDAHKVEPPKLAIPADLADLLPSIILNFRLKLLSFYAGALDDFVTDCDTNDDYALRLAEEHFYGPETVKIFHGILKKIEYGIWQHHSDLRDAALKEVFFNQTIWALKDSGIFGRHQKISIITGKAKDRSENIAPIFGHMPDSWTTETEEDRKTILFFKTICGQKVEQARFGFNSNNDPVFTLPSDHCKNQEICHFMISVIMDMADSLVIVSPEHDILIRSMRNKRWHPENLTIRWDSTNVSLPQFPADFRPIGFDEYAPQ